jgi:hypothetical protein
LRCFAKNFLPDVLTHKLVKDRRATQCITYATLASILFSSLCAAAGPPTADLVLINGNVRTLDRSAPLAEALAVSGGKITAVGSNPQIRKLIGERTRVIDAKGRLVLPGFNDAHVHFAAIGNKFSSIDLRKVRTAEEMAARFAEYVRYLPKGRWILGSGFDPALATKDGGKLRQLADDAAPDNPVFVYSTDVTLAFANGEALSRATNAAAAGSAGGFLRGGAVGAVASIVPRDHVRNWPEIIQTATNYAASLGITSVQDMHSDDMTDVCRGLEQAGKLKTRVYDCVPISYVSDLAANGVKAAKGTAMVRTGCVKSFSDGDETEAVWLRRDIAAADKAGVQVMVHAIGPRANAVVLDAFESVARANGRRDRRFRVEHAHNAADPDLPRFARAGIIASMQPWLFFAGSHGSVFERHLKLGTRIAFGSDASMTDLDPLLGIQAAITGPGAVGLEDAVRAYTVGSTFAEFQEKVKGTIERGKLADLVIISDDIFTIDPKKIRNAEVVVTVVSGRIVYEKQELIPN